jgi:hypothetical protein
MRRRCTCAGDANAQEIRALSFDTDYRAFELPGSALPALSIRRFVRRLPNLGGLPANVCGFSMFPIRRQAESPHVTVKPSWRTASGEVHEQDNTRIGIGASLILAAGSASAAGSCGAEVATLQQKLGHQDSANATIGATDPGVQQPSPTASADTSTTTSSTSDQVAESNSGANATIGATDPGVQQPAPEATATTGTSTTTTTDGSSTATADDTGANATRPNRSGRAAAAKHRRDRG